MNWLFASRVATVVASSSTYIAVTEGLSDVAAKGHPGFAVYAILAHSCLWLAGRAFAVERLREEVLSSEEP